MKQPYGDATLEGQASHIAVALGRGHSIFKSNKVLVYPRGDLLLGKKKKKRGRKIHDFS